MFEYHVILPSSKPNSLFPVYFCAFEYHVILSSSKPSKRWGFLIDLCSKWAQVFLRFLCAFQVEMYAKILGPAYLRTIRFYSSSKWADLICHTRYVWVPCNLLPSNPRYAALCRNDAFEYHVILPFSKPNSLFPVYFCAFEYHVISSSSKPISQIKRPVIVFENPVISSTFKARTLMSSTFQRFENPVISSTFKVSKCCGWNICFCSLWAQVYTLLWSGSFAFQSGSG